jgi:multidrug efflux system membrane fusion protein
MDANNKHTLQTSDDEPAGNARRPAMSAQAFSQRNRLAIAVGGALTLTVLAAGLLMHRPSGAAAPQAPQAMPVMVAAVVPTEVTPWDEFSGRLEAVERVDVRSRVAGAVQAVHFREGALVNAGDLLVTIDPAPYAAEVDRANAQLLAAQARLDNATSELERAQRLWEESAIAKRELDERVSARREAAANVSGAQAALQSAKLNLSYTQVRAPVSGRVGKLETTVGNLVPAGPGAPVLTTLVSVNPIYASFDADEQVVTRALRALQGPPRRGIEAIPVQLETEDSSGPLKGHLQLVDNQVNAKSGTVRVRAVFDNADGHLIPGQFATLKLGRVAPQEALLLSERAVGTDQSKRFVFVVDGENKAVYREVTLGPTVDGLRIVTSGLNPNERVVVNGLQRVRPGALLAPQVAPQGTKTASN